jgi:tRNA threonylcarbamoyladenosine biosynthesis protein TsaB
MILAIETSTEICSAALVHENSALTHRSVNEKNIHSELLMVLIDEILKEANVSLKSLEAIAVSIGPGSFTGLRIGLSAAKGLALALGISLVPVPTLDGIAEEYRRTRTSAGSEQFCACIDAKRNEAFFSFYDISSRGIQRLTEYSIKAKEEIDTEAMERNSAMENFPPNAVSIGLLAEQVKSTAFPDDFSLLEPLYLRDFVATLPKK